MFLQWPLSGKPVCLHDYFHQFDVELLLGGVLEAEATQKSDQSLIVDLDECRQYPLLQPAQRIPLEEPLRLVELAFKTDLVGYLRTDGTLSAGMECLPHLRVLVRCNRFYLDQLSRAVGLTSKI